MGKKKTYKSPLAKLEHEANKKKISIEKSRLSVTSTYSSDSVSTTGRLLDKLRLADDEWKYDDEDSYNSTESFINLENSVGSKLEYSSEESMNESQSSIPASKFRYLKSVLGSTKKKNIQNSAASKALEMGKKINTVEQNASRVTNRADVRSIHLDNLLHDAAESILSLSSEEDEENASDNDTINDEREGPSVINVPTHISQQTSYKSVYSSTDLPQTPTRSMMERTPVNSPEVNYRRHTPQNSIGATPKQILGHKHTLSNISNASYGSYNTDFMNDSLIHNIPNDDIVFDHKEYQLRDSQPKKPSHTHTQSAIHVNIQEPEASEASPNSSLIRSASAPIQRKPSIKQSPVPNKPLPPNPPLKVTPRINPSLHVQQMTLPTSSSSTSLTPSTTNLPAPSQPKVIHPNQHYGAPPRIMPQHHHHQQFHVQQPQQHLYKSNQYSQQQAPLHQFPSHQQIPIVLAPTQQSGYPPMRQPNLSMDKPMRAPASPTQQNVYMDAIPNQMPKMKNRGYGTSYSNMPPYMRSPQQHKISKMSPSMQNDRQNNGGANPPSSPHQPSYHNHQHYPQQQHYQQNVSSVIYPPSHPQPQPQPQPQLQLQLQQQPQQQQQYYQGRSLFYHQAPQQYQQVRSGYSDQPPLKSVPPELAPPLMYSNHNPYATTRHEYESHKSAPSVISSSLKRNNKYQDVNLSYVVPR
jgi:hypothetical protein